MSIKDCVFLDTETTGTDPERHEVWEIGLIVAEEVPHDPGIEWREYRYLLPVDLSKADATALRISHYYERSAPLRAMLPGESYDAMHIRSDGSEEVAYSHRLALELATLTANKHIVGAVPSFDAAFLTKWLHKFSLTPAWHYHLVDIEVIVAGDQRVEPPWSSDELSISVGVDPEVFDRHTALGDARWVKAQYEAIMG